jgi:3-hydroxyisobutyrate dehydrogenase-like beta-hydroxyacid dehydrogenase
MFSLLSVCADLITSVDLRSSAGNQAQGNSRQAVAKAVTAVDFIHANTYDRLGFCGLQMNKTISRVGFIGLGRMGAPMAANVCRAGYDLTVYDLRDAQVGELALLGARAARSPAEVAELSELIELAVVDDAQVEQVLAGKDGVFESAKPESIVAIHSTVFPETVKRLAAFGRNKQIHIFDVPVSGGEAGAREKKLCYMAGGDEAILARCRGIFLTSAAHILYLGSLGSGARAKLIVQMVTCMHMLAAHEAELMSRKCGLDFTVLRELLALSSAQSFVGDHWIERFKRAGDPMSIRKRRTEVFQQSLAPALEVARNLDLLLPGTELAHRLLPFIMEVEGGDKKEAAK